MSASYVDFRQLVNQLPKGASFTILSDSCHSGGLIDKEKEQIGPSTYRAASSLSYKAKNIPFESILEHLTTLTGINTSDIDETSADMNPMESGGKAYGAFSNAVQMVLKENSGRLSNKEVVMMARKVLEAQGFDQHPCLYCSDENTDATFLCQPEAKPY
ncbi:hypothetical protein GOBAR_DD35569 [Gossypium barbadense]|nr:hypothetical protein GOBAR_DD35569 [Gossypium barbadense]